MKFRKVTIKDAEFLYRLLKERPAEVNISHIQMPTFANHCRFIMSKPYKAWYIIHDKKDVGSIYVSMLNEIGIFILQEFQRQGYAEKAIKKMTKKHSNLLANINPANEKSINLFKKLGFKHIQNTYYFANSE